jgi:hypothetical protein
MAPPNEKYVVYAVRQLPGELFGEAYAVVTATRASGKDWRAAWHLLTLWPAEALHQGSVVVSGEAVPRAQRLAVPQRVLDAGQSQAKLSLQAL